MRYQVLIKNDDDWYDGETVAIACLEAPIFDSLELAKTSCENGAFNEFGSDHQNLQHGLTWYSDEMVNKHKRRFTDDLIAEAGMPGGWHCYVFEI